MVMPYVPMLVPPVNWTGYVLPGQTVTGNAWVNSLNVTNHFVLIHLITILWKKKFLMALFWVFRYDKGGHLFLSSYIMRTHGARQQREAIKRAPRQQMQAVFEVLYHENLLNLNIAHATINSRILSIHCTCNRKLKNFFNNIYIFHVILGCRLSW